jgi:hypothetical protein
MTFPNTAPVATPEAAPTDATTTANNDLSRRRVLDVYKQMLLSLFVALLMVIGILFVPIILFSISYGKGDASLRDPSILTAVQFAGTLGALFSTLIRLYNLEDISKGLVARELEGLSWAYLLVYSLVPPVLGFVSATAIHMLFASGLLAGDLFPKFVCKVNGVNQCLSFGTLITEWGPEQAKDYAKVIVWGFVAGFAERLVPDMLRSLSKSAQQRDGAGT